MSSPVRTRAIVLAAGAGSRFGGRKLEARLDGVAVLQRVLDALASAGIEDPIVVVRRDGMPDIEWRRAEPVVNPQPDRGLASSLQVGWRAAMAGGSSGALGGLPETDVDSPGAVLVVLGDQPLLRPEVVRALLLAPPDATRPIVAPRYGNAGTRNPVRIEAAGENLVLAATGDRGLGPLIEANAGLVRWIDVDGDNPDIDTPADLARAAELAWAERVRANRDQVDRVREAPDGKDFYASVTSIFRDDPDRSRDAVLDALRGHARPGDTWLDIGAGAGRYALPIARAVRRVVAIDPSRSMLEALRTAQAEHRIENVDAIEGRWPDAAAIPALAAGFPVDVALIAHVGYDVESIGPFLAAMERAASRECLAILMERSPASLAEPFWPPIYGEERISLPALPAFVDLLRARDRDPRVEMVESSGRRWGSREEVETFVRRQTWTTPGSAKDRIMQELLDERLVATSSGEVELAGAGPLRVGLVSWAPG